MSSTNKIDSALIEQAKSSIVSVIERYLPDLQKAGTEYEACCPFHDERSPSFKVNEAKEFFYCLAAETGVITPTGVFPIQELSGGTHKILTAGGDWVDAKFDSYGVQRLLKMTLSRNGVKKVIFATPEHRWFIRGRSTALTTSDLRAGNRLQSVFPHRPSDFTMSKDGITHGVVFGDGTKTNGDYGLVALHGSKAGQLGRLIHARSKKVRTSHKGSEFLQCYGGLDYAHMKNLPSLDDSKAYLLGWLAGYFATDGHVSKDGTAMLNSSVMENLEFARCVATKLGIGTYGITSQSRTGYGAEPSDIYRIHFMNSTLDAEFFLCVEDRERFSASKKIYERTRWSVESVEQTDRVEEVFCALVPGTHSFAIEDNILTGNCFGCGVSGDSVDFVMNYENVSFPEAVRRITGSAAPTNAPARAPAKKAPPPLEWKAIYPIPEPLAINPPDVLNRKIDGEWVKMPLVTRWAYRDASGGLLGYVARFNKPTGGKDVMPQTWCVNTQTGEMAWRWQSFDEPRPIYGLDKLAANPKAQVMIVEGEKSADAGQAIAAAKGIGTDKLVVLAWPGGGKAIDKIDWSPLYGRNIGLWPDRDQKNYPEKHAKAGQKVPFLDQPGIAAMLAIFDRLQEHCPPMKFIVPPAGTPCGWDIADEFPEGVTLLAHAKAAAMPAADVRTVFAENQPDPEPEPPSPSAPDYDYADYAEQAEAHEQYGEPESITNSGGETGYVPTEEEEYLAKNAFFTILGYDHGDHYIFSHTKQQVLRVGKGEFGSDIAMIELAHPHFWQLEFPSGDKKDGFDRKAAAAWFFNISHSRGIYDPSRIRGRGAWLDNGRSVFHHGDRLSVDGVAVNISKISSSYVYPRARAMPPLSDNPLTDAEGAHLLEVAKMARWTMPASAALLVGFVMLAGICGALKWRPHLWLTGAAGSGKSTILNDFVCALLDGIAVFGNGNSTEAGLRQTLKADAVPVLLDEVESNTEKERQRMEGLMSMIRQSSSESGAKTYKGTTFGEAMNFHVRSMFCLSSINTLLSNKADIDRLTKLSLLKPASGGVDRWAELEESLHVIKMDGEYPQRIMARAVNMLPTILENIKVFTKVAAKEFGSQRDGDQFGTLMAGAWSMISNEKVTDTQALLTIRKFDWKEHTEDHNQDDALRALETILSHKVRMPGPVGDLSVYELIRETLTLHRIGTVEYVQADAALRRHGIIVRETAGEILFGITCTPLIDMVKGSSFATDLRGQLMRVPGAERKKNVSSFNGAKSRVVAIPISQVIEVDDGDDLL